MASGLGLYPGQNQKIQAVGCDHVIQDKGFFDRDLALNRENLAGVMDYTDRL